MGNMILIDGGAPKFSMSDVLNKTLDTMQDALTHYRISGYPPDIMINIPTDVCDTIDFHKAKEIRNVTKKILKEIDDD